MKKVMVLGAGRGQVHLIDLFHRYGCQVCVVSPPGNYPGFAMAEDALYVDIQNKDVVLEYARREKICGITTDQLDEGVSTVAYVAEKLHIPGIPYDLSLKFTNKYTMRQAAAATGIHVPWAFCAATAKEAEMIISENCSYTFPMVIKPVASSASRGVYKVEDIDDLESHFDSSLAFSKSQGVIVEQFISGQEFVVESFVRDGIVNALMVGQRNYFDVNDTFIPCSTVFCDAISADTILDERLKQTNKQLITSMQLPFGLTHAEFLYNKDEDKIYLVEIAARGGGVFTSSELIPAACGVNADELLIREVLGLEDKKPIEIRRGAAAYFCYLVNEGTVTKLDGVDEVSKIPGVIHAYFDNIKLGMKTSSICDKSSRKGPILIGGGAKSECYEIMNRVKEVLDIRVETPAGEEPAIWK